MLPTRHGQGTRLEARWGPFGRLGRAESVSITECFMNGKEARLLHLLGTTARRQTGLAAVGASPTRPHVENAKTDSVASAGWRYLRVPALMLAFVLTSKSRRANGLQLSRSAISHITPGMSA